MQKQILAELKELRSIMARLIGTSDFPLDEQFSIEALNKASKQFQKMKLERGEWITENDIGKFIKGGDWRTGKFIRTEFRFTSFIKQGHYYLYRKKDLAALNTALKERNVNLKRYIEYKWQAADFKKKLAADKKAIKGNRPYYLPADLKDITTSSVALPCADLVREDLKRLKEEFFQNKLSEYIDIYNGTHAMMKFIYHFEKYIEPQVKKQSKKWCENFNYANHALELITKKREVFVPVKEEEMIEL